MEQERKVEPIGRELVRRLLPRRDPEGHKGTFGKVLCLCGSVGYTGAPVFASRGAVRSGAGLVFLGVPESIWPVAAVCCWGPCLWPPTPLPPLSRPGDSCSLGRAAGL